MIKAKLRVDGGLDVEILGAEASMLTTMSYEQQIEVDELLTRLICNATIATVNGGQLPKLRVI